MQCNTQTSSYPGRNKIKSRTRYIYFEIKKNKKKTTKRMKEKLTIFKTQSRFKHLLAILRNTDICKKNKNTLHIKKADIK